MNRKEFDIGTDWVHSAIPNFIGDEVTVEIDLWTRPPKKRQYNNEARTFQGEK